MWYDDEVVGYDSLRSAYEFSRSNRRPDESAAVNNAVAAGKFAVVASVLECCPHTDAILGRRLFLRSTHDTLEAAELALALAAVDETPDADFDLFVLPEQPAPVAAALPAADGELPF